jgi:hypothetical protein
MSKEPTRRLFGDAIADLVEDEGQHFIAQEVFPETDAEVLLEEDEVEDVKQFGEPTEKKPQGKRSGKGKPKFKDIHALSIKTAKSQIRKKHITAIIKNVLKYDTAVNLASYMDVAVNAAIIIGVLVLIYQAIHYVSQGNAVMALSCGALIWILAKLNDRMEQE